MKKFMGMLFLAAMCAGCAGLPNSILPPTVTLPSDRLTPGITRAAVVAIMDAPVTVGYEIDPFSGVSRPIKVQSLYSSELITLQGGVYQVDRYIVRAPAAGATVAEENLYPVVYKDGLLAAKGRDGLAGLKANEK